MASLYNRILCLESSFLALDVCGLSLGLCPSQSWMGDRHLARGPQGANEWHNEQGKVPVLSVGYTERVQVVMFWEALETSVQGFEE